MHFRFFFIFDRVRELWRFPQAFHPLLGPRVPGEQRPQRLKPTRSPLSIMRPQYEADLINCTPSSHVFPSLLGDLADIDLVNRSHIRGYEDENCLVDYTFAESRSSPRRRQPIFPAPIHPRRLNKLSPHMSLERGWSIFPINVYLMRTGRVKLGLFQVHD